MTKLTSALVCGAAWLALAVACSDDDGSNVVANGPPGAGSGGGGAGGAPEDAGLAGAAGSAGRAGAAGSAGAAGGVGCVPVFPDAGVAPGDAGADAGELDAGDASTDASAPPAPIGAVSFASDLLPIFEASCSPCHVTLGYGGHNVAGPLPGSYQDALELGPELLFRIDGGGMPPDCNGDPGDPGCLSVDQVARVRAWIDQCSPE